MSDHRYRKQELFQGLGRAGQEALEKSSILVAGVGALGGTIAALMVRAGIGLVRLVDRDSPELGNLHRQLLYTEPDLAVGHSKARLAREKLVQTNSRVRIQGIEAEIDRNNILDLCRDMDLILDGLDNQETRYLLNDAAVKLGIPWIYAGCVAASGNVMTVIPGLTPCLRCIFPHPSPPGVLPSCDTHGILGPAASLTASAAAAEAIRFLAGGFHEKKPLMLRFDLWNMSFRTVALPPEPDPDCPCCGQKRFDSLEGRLAAR